MNHHVSMTIVHPYKVDTDGLKYDNTVYISKHDVEAKATGM